MRMVAGLLALSVLGSVSLGQTLDLSGPQKMGRCEEALFTISFTADAVQTGSQLVFQATRPNAGFLYVLNSGRITLHDGTTVPAEPTQVGLHLVWDLDLILGTPYALPAGETVTLEFALATGCGTVSGTLGARVDYYVEDGSPRYATDSQPIEILPGAVLIRKEPSVTQAAVGDVVTWTLVVENTGLGPIYNVVVTDVLGSGLAYVGSTPAGTPLGQTVTWEVPEIPAGGRVEIALRAQVIACTGLENRVDARFGCNDGSVCFDTAVQGGTATASIRLLLGQPLLEFDPPEIRVPYCSPAGATVTIPVRNVGDGNARDIRICADYTPFTVANVAPPASYDGSCFHIPDLAPNETFSIQFDLVYFGDWCTPPGRRDVFYYPVYRNDCGEEFRPPVAFGSYSVHYGTQGPPTLSLSLTGISEVHICQDVAYLVTAGFSGLSSCGGGTQGDITVVVTVPEGFTVEDAGGGVWVPGPGGTGGTITWTFTPPSSLDTPIVLRPPGARQCGTLATLSATASATDCCGCPLSVSQAIPIAIECRTLVGSTKVASPPAQEKCGRITYTNTYTFADSALLDEVSFDELTFVESATNLQAYVRGSLVITIDGGLAAPLTLVDGTPGGTLQIWGIKSSDSVRGRTLVISYVLEITPGSQPNACPGSYGFYSWSTLSLGPDCRNEDECAQYCTKAEAEWVMTETPAMAVGLTGLPDLVDPCGTYTVTLTLTKTSTYDPHDVVLQLGNLNYYIVDLGSIVCSGDVTPTNCTAPIDRGTYYEWTYGEAFVGLPAGARSVLTFQVKKRCGPGVDLTATARYRDACGGACSGSATDTPLLLRRPNLFVYKTPDVHYATTNTLTWTIYVVNSGAGWAYDVWVDDLLGSGLEYVSSSVAPATGVTTTPGYDHLGNPINGVSWRIAAMSPGEQRVITLVTRLVSCTDLTNQVWASLGCGGEDCLPPVSDSSYVLIPTTQLTVTSSTASPIAICATQPARISIRNAGDPAVYNLVVRETLPPGLRYVPGTTRWRKSGGPWLPGSDPTIDGDTLEWTELEVGGLAELRSRGTLEIEFDVQALCDFTGGDLRVSGDYVNVCGQPGTLPVGTFHINVRRPSLAVEKNQISPPGNGPVDCGGEITWRIDVTNTGQIPVPYVWVEDELGSGFVYVSSTGGVYGVDAGCRSGSTVTWALRNLPPGATAQLTLTARETGCGELRNFVRVWWGCGQDDGSSCTLDAECLAETYVYRDVGASRTPNVAVSASLNPTQVPACGTTTMTLEIRNPSSATASALDVRIQLPAGLSYVPGTTEIDCGTGFIPRLDPEELGGYLDWYDPVDPEVNICDVLPPGGTVRLRFRVQASCYRTTGNAAVQVYFYDCCLTTQQEFDASYPLHPAVPTLTITKLPATVPLDCYDPGSTVTWQIRVQNTGAASADWVRVEDTLGTNLVYVGSSPAATEMGGQRWGWEFGPLLAGESRTLEITVRLSQPSNDCASALRTNTAQAWWGCGSFDGDPRTVEGCTGGGPVTATARATIPDLNLGSTDILPILTCVSDGNYTGRVQITIRNLGDAPVTRDFRLTITESTSGWSVSGLFAADFGGTLPIAAGGTRTITVPNWPVTCGQCSYSFTVTLDTTDAICECRENNNSATRAWTITLPDLTVRDQGIALTCTGDGQVRISGTVTLGNEGCGSPLTANVPLRFTIYSRAGCGGTVLHQWTQTLTGVNIPAKGQQVFTIAPQTINLNACGTAEGCTLSLLIEVDHTNSICECDGANNTRCVDLPVNIPDLTVRSEALALTCAGDGLVRISGTVTLGNEGCGTTLTANVPVRFTLRSGSGCAGTVLYTWTGTFTGVNIPAGGEQAFNVDHTFALNLCTVPTCTVSLLIEADHTGSICECNGTNNTLCVDLPVDIPDLAVVEVVPDVRNACARGTVDVTVENVGCVAAPAGIVVRITGDATGRILLPALPPGGSATVTVPLDEVLPCGSYAITATVDPDDGLCECAAANNALGAEFNVVDPDLTLTDLSVQCRGDGSFTAAATVRNTGTEASPATTVRIYVDGGLFQTVTIPGLPIGGAYPVTYVTPRIKCGADHLFRLVVDEEDQICECNAGNNAMEALARCGCPALVTRKSITQVLRAGIPVPTNAPVEPGDLVTYTLTVTNVGSGWAFNVDLWDELPVEFAYVAGSTSASWPGGESTADPTGAPGPSLAWDLSAILLPAETLTLQFQALVTSLARQGFSYTNTMGATGEEGDGTPIPPDNNLPGDDDPDDSDSVIHPAAVPALALDKAITDILRGGIGRGPAGPVEPGDVIIYTVTIRNVGFGVAYDVDFTDVLPPGVEYETAHGDGTYTVDNPAASGSLGIPDGVTGLVTADISATIAAGGTLVATYRVRVLSTVSQGVPLINSAAATGEDGAGTPIPEFNPDVPDTYPDRDFTRIPVVEPGLALDKEIVDVLRGGVSIWPTPIVLWGDVIVYRVTVRNVGLGTAYDVDLADELPFGLAYDTSGDGTYTVDSPAASGSLGIPDGTTGTIYANISATLAGGGTLVAVYRARVLPEAVPGQYLVNRARVTGKDGAGTPIPEFNPDVADTYLDEDTTRILLGVPALVTKKEVFCEACPCDPAPAPCDPCAMEPVPVKVGERVTFRLTVANVGHSRAYDVVVHERLPEGLVYVGETTRVVWPGGESEADPVGTPGPLLTWITGASLDAGESLTVTFDARVAEGAPLGEALNTMWATGADAFAQPIPADSSTYVPADNDPDDLSTLRLQVGPPLGGSTPRGTAGGWLLGGMGALLAGVAALRFRLARSWLVLLLGLLAVGATAVGSPYTITVRTEPPKAGVIFGAGVYPAGETVRLTALPNRGFELVGWFEDGVELSTLPLLEFPADRHRTLVAKFRPILELVGLSGLWDGSLTLLPTPALGRNRFEVRPRFVFGPAPWDLRIVALFTGASWTDAQGHFTGAWEAFRFGGGLVFNPALPAYRSGYLALSWPWDDLRLGLRVTHYALSGTPPAPYLLYDLSLSTANLLVSVRAEEREGIRFRDLTVQLLKVELCCGIQAQGLMSFTKAGFSSARVSVMDLPWVCCGLSWDFTVAFTPGAKAVEVAPRWDPYCDACLTLYGDVLWDKLTSTWEGLALYGYKIRCCWGGCCPQTRAPAGYIEFLTAFDPRRLPGGFRGDEFEYIKVGACGPGCCGEGYTFEVTAYFAPTGLFGLSRFRITAGIPLGRGFVVTPTLEISGTGAALELSWRFRF